jgi:xylan 1,4-beta-xylosidase
MFSLMSGNRVTTTSTAEISLDAILKSGVRGPADVAAFASFDGRRLCIMVWNYHDDDVAGPDADVALTASGLGASASTAVLTHYRVDGTHSNCYTAWKKLGSPLAPNEKQYAELEQAGKLAQLEAPRQIQIAQGSATLNFTLPRQGVSLLVFELPATK